MEERFGRKLKGVEVEQEKEKKRRVRGISGSLEVCEIPCRDLVNIPVVVVIWGGLVVGRKRKSHKGLPSKRLGARRGTSLNGRGGLKRKN